MKISIFTGGTSVGSKSIFTDISRYPTRKHEINSTFSLAKHAIPSQNKETSELKSRMKMWTVQIGDHTAHSVQSHLDLHCP